MGQVTAPRMARRTLALYHRFLRSVVGVVVGLTLTLVFGLADMKASAASELTPPAPGPTAAAKLATPNPLPSDLATEFGKDWWRSKDFIITSSGDANGMHYYIAREGEGYYWRPLASILP